MTADCQDLNVLSVDQDTLDATEDKIFYLADSMFDAEPELESFSWSQGYAEDGAIFCAEEFIINDHTMHGGDSAWRSRISFQLKDELDTIEPLHLIALYGKNINVRVTRYDVEILSLDCLPE